MRTCQLPLRSLLRGSSACGHRGSPEAAITVHISQPRLPAFTQTRLSEGGSIDMAGGGAGKVAAHAAYKGPSIVKEIMYGISLGLAAGGLWKMHHWNNQRRTREFYDLLEKGVISVVVEDDQ